MNRLRMSNLADQPLNLSNEIIDLTGDSPIVASAQSRGPRARHTSLFRRANNNVTRNLLDYHDLAIPQLYDPLTSLERHDSSIQVIDPDEAHMMGQRFRSGEEFRAPHRAQPNEEYSTAVPCLNDSHSGKQIVLSCPICFEALSADRRPMATSCGHIFCAGCLKSALERSGSKSCPKCNTTVKIKSCIRLYF